MAYEELPSVFWINGFRNIKYDMFKSNEIHPNIEKGIENAINIVIKSLPKIKNLL